MTKRGTTKCKKRTRAQVIKNSEKLLNKTNDDQKPKNMKKGKYCYKPPNEQINNYYLPAFLDAWPLPMTFDLLLKSRLVNSSSKT